MITWTITQAGHLATSGSADTREGAAGELLAAAHTLIDTQPHDTAARYRLELAGALVAEIGIPAGSDRFEVAAHLEHLGRSLRETDDVGEGR